MITSKKVTRWYFNGKGYGNKFHACRAATKKELKTTIYNEAVRRHGFVNVWPEFEDLDCYEVPNFGQDEINRIYAEMFPHGEMGECARVCYTDEYGDFAYPWCKKAWKEWIDRRARELMQEPAEEGEE